MKLPFVTASAALALAPTLAAQTPVDINTVGVPDPVMIGNAQVHPFSFTQESPPFVALNGGWLMTVDTVAQGRELWFTDGTDAGTHLLVDVVPGGWGSEPNDLIPVPGGALFTTEESSNSAGLWFTDGTPAGTHRVWTSTSFTIDHLIVAGGTAYFRALGGPGGKGPLWKSDGTFAGTQVVPIGPPFFPDNHISDMAVLPGSTSFCFVTSTGLHGLELWISDGTTAGTQLLVDLVPGPFGSSPQDLTPWNGQLVFIARKASGEYGLFVTDGTPAGTQLAHLFVPQEGLGFRLGESVVFGGDLYFPANLGNGLRLCRFDGTTLVEAVPTGAGAPVDALGAVEFAGALYFIADSDLGHELWRTDGTPAGTALVKDVAPGPTSGIHTKNVRLNVAGGRLWFTGTPDGVSKRLWVSDGTTAGTVNAHGAGFAPFADSARHVTAFDETRVLFAAEEGRGARGLWLSDGTPGGMQPVVTWTGGNASSDPRSLVSPDGEDLLFRADDGVHGAELYGWSAAGGAQLVADLMPGAAGSEPRGLVPLWCAGRQLTFFTADTPGLGREVWVTDGTTLGTVRLVDAEPGAADGVDDEVRFTVFGERVVFVAGATTPRLWSTDGTPGGTAPLFGALLYGEFKQHYEHIALGDRLLFTTRLAPLQYGLWSTDGTSAGTSLVASFDKGVPYYMASTDEVVAFVCDTQALGHELWVTDGTPAGTVVHDLEPGAIGSEPSDLIEHEGALYFVARTSVTSEELWRLTSATSVPVAVSDVWAVGIPGDFRSLASTGDGLFFTTKAAFATTAKWELWRTFGVPFDAAQVAFGGGTIDDDVSGLLGVGPGVVVTTTDPTGKSQLRLVSGAGVTTLTDAALGPRDLVVAGSRLFFNAHFGDFGRELGSIELPGAYAGDLGGATSGASMTLTPPRIGLGSVVRMEGLPLAPGFVALVYSYPSAPYSIPAVADGAGIWLAPGSLSVALFPQVGTQFQQGISLPPNPGLAGLALHAQGFHLPTSGGAMTATNGVKLVLGA